MLTIAHPLGDIRLRPYTALDAQADWELESDPVVKRYLGGPVTQTSEQRATLFDPEKLSSGGWQAIATVEGDQLIGRVGLCPQEEFPGQLELSIVLARSHMGRGLGRVLANALLEQGFSDPAIEAIRAACHPDHRASLALLADMGFVETVPGIFERHHGRDAFILPRERWAQRIRT